MTRNKFTDTGFYEKFANTLQEYNEAIDSGKEPPTAAQEFMQSMFDNDFDAAFQYSEVLNELDDAKTARILQDIVVNSSVSILR